MRQKVELSLIASLVLASFVAQSAADAQAAAPPRFPEPVLIDTPWGDFPLERVQPGARLRFTSSSGRTVVRVAALRDSTLEVRSNAGDSLPPVSFAQLRTFQRVEVNAMPVWRDRAGNYGLLIGAVAGAFAGWAVHNARSSNATRRPKLGEDMAECASLGSLAGFLTARIVVARPRWRPVTLP